MNSSSGSALESLPAQAAVGQSQPVFDDHLVPLPGGRWAMWKWFCLRGAGFSERWALELASPACAAAADEVLRAEVEAAERQKEDIESVKQLLDHENDLQKRKLLLRTLKHLKKGRIPEPPADPSEPGVPFRDACQRLEAARKRLETQLEQNAVAVSEKIREIAMDPRFRQAVLLQNAGALRRVIRGFLRPGDESQRRKSREKQDQELIASYVQRYCLKNDTIGFFGPVGWAKLVTTGESIKVVPGAEFLSKSSIYFENWTIETLADKMTADKRLRPWLAPRLLPWFFVEDNTLYSPGGVSAALDPAHAAILKRCRQDRTAKEIARDLMAMPGAGIHTERQVYDILEQYESRGIISWKLELAICLHPERRLRELLDRVEDDELRRSHLQVLDRLDQARNDVGRAFGDPDGLDRSLDLLDSAFTEITGCGSTKAAGEMYAARTLIYQDCLRDLDLEIGPELIASLGQPLTLLLTGARWFSYRVAQTYRESIIGFYEDLARKNSGGRVDFLQLWAKVETFILDPSRRLANHVLPQFQQNWSEILRLPDDKRRVQYCSKDLEPAVDRLFAAPQAGWSVARYHSPDVMIAASSLDEIRRGNFLFVLGELHMTQNTVRYSFAASQHPQPEELLTAVHRDIPGAHVVPVPPRRWPRNTNRTTLFVLPEGHLHLEMSRDSISSLPRSRILPILTFVLERSSQGIIARTRDGRFAFDIIEFLGEILSGITVEMMKIVPPRRHTPRVTIDRLVVCRESWSFALEEVPFGDLQDEQAQFLEAKRWQRQHDLPRFVFVRIPVEVKPFYVDFDSTLYVSILAKMLRKMAASNKADERVTVTEMLPASDQLWLPDSQGQKYTCELRLVAVDRLEPAFAADRENIPTESMRT